MNAVLNKDNMSIARGRLGLYAGFWLALASKMQWIASDRAPGGVAATDGRHVWYNKENMNARPIGDVVFIALHEIGHPMLCHLIRRGNRDPKIYGAAIDIVLNKLLAKIAQETPQLKMTVPDDALLGAAFGLTDDEVTTVEAVYEKLLKQCQQQKKGKAKVKGEGQGNDPGQGMPSFDDHEDPTNDDGSPLTEAQKESTEKEWRVAVQAAAVMAKQMGKLPGFMEEFIGELMQPKVDWRSQLWNACKVAKDESSYRRFNRRHLARRTYLPGMYSERIGEVGYFVDVSGSVSSAEATQAISEMNYLLEEMKPDRIHFGQIDTRIHSVDELVPDDVPLKVTIKGRGGTNMQEAFEWACEHEDQLDMFILQTDGFVPALPPDLHPSCPVVIIKTTGTRLPSGWDFPVVIEVQV